MKPERLMAFSDGVIAIIITIMVLELKAPHGADWSDLTPLLPVFLSYVLSFIYIAIFWNNHHHLLHTVETVDGKTLWANMHLLFWLSLIPFATAWMGENHFESLPAALYGVPLLMSAVAYYILQTTIIQRHGEEGPLAQALGSDLKGKLSPVLYTLAIALSFVLPKLALALYVGTALMWFIPDRRIEQKVEEKEAKDEKESS